MVYFAANMKKVLGIIAFLALALLVYLSIFNEGKNSKKVDVSHIETDTEIFRYDREFFNIDTADLIRELQTLREDDSLFFSFYTEQLMNFGRFADTISPVT